MSNWIGPPKCGTTFLVAKASSCHVTKMFGVLDATEDDRYDCMLGRRNERLSLFTYEFGESLLYDKYLTSLTALKNSWILGLILLQKYECH